MKSNKNRDKKVVFVHTPCSELYDDRLEPPLGILYLATLLKEKGIICQICDLSGMPENKWQDNLAIGDIYGFSTYSATYYQTLKIRDIAKNLNTQAITIAGGPHVSALLEECSKDFDIIITGEAEITFLEVIKNIQEGKEIRGVFRGDSVMDLDQLPFPDYELIDMSSYHRIVGGLHSISLISSRGCPYNCTFCNSRIFSRGKLRFRSPENVVQEILQLQDKYGNVSFRFNDDLFTFSPERITQMSTALKPLNILYRIFARSNSMTQEASEQLYESGCRHVAIGIESMSEKMLKLFKKGTTVKNNIEALKNSRAAGLKVRIYLLIGFPGETEKTVQESLKILLNCDFDEFVVYSFIPYPGTPVWQNPELWGAKIDRDFSKYFQLGPEHSTCYAVTTKDFTPDDVKRWRQMMIDALKQKATWAGDSIDYR